MELLRSEGGFLDVCCLSGFIVVQSAGSPIVGCTPRGLEEKTTGLACGLSLSLVYYCYLPVRSGVPGKNPPEANGPASDLPSPLWERNKVSVPEGAGGVLGVTPGTATVLFYHF